MYKYLTQMQLYVLVRVTEMVQIIVLYNIKSQVISTERIPVNFKF